MSGTLMTSRPVRSRTRYVGKPIDRVDGVAKTTGAARYSAEYAYPDLAFAALVYATVARGRITRIEPEAASAVPGVIMVITHQNALPMNPPRAVTLADIDSLAAGTSVNYLNTEDVHWNGQPVAVVVAESVEIAQYAAQLVRVAYEPAPAKMSFAAEQDTAKPQESSPLQQTTGVRGDALAALTAAPVAVDGHFSTPAYNHNAIEPHATTASWEGNFLTVHEGSQKIPWVCAHLAWKFGVPVGNVRVVSTYVGGGFGSKTMVWAGTILTALAARMVGRPVRMMLTREGVFRTVGGRTPSRQRVAIGAERDGRFTALVHTTVTQVGKVGSAPEPVTAVSRHLYDAENILLQQNIVEMDLLSNTSMRAPGDAIGSFALEAAVDDLAYELGIDPVDLRMRNEPARDPLDGREFSHRMLREVWALGAEKFGWADRSPQRRAMRDGRWLVGMGAAAAYHPSWQFAANLVIRLSSAGQVLVRCAFHEMGMGGATACAQITADLLGVPVEAVRVEYGDSDLPIGPSAGGSAQTASVAASLDIACTELKESILELAAKTDDSPLRGLCLPDLAARDAGLFRIDLPEVGERYREILERAGQEVLEASVGSDTQVGPPGFIQNYIEDKKRWMKAACGAQFCEVRVDPDTGEVRVSRWVGVFDVGTVVNAKTARSQFRGGIIMGIGMALTEETLIDPRSGRIMNPSLAAYHIPTHADVPPIDVFYLDVPDPAMPLGIVGIGEVGITGTAAAISNAICHATGVRVRDLPITLDDLL